MIIIFKCKNNFTRARKKICFCKQIIHVPIHVHLACQYIIYLIWNIQRNCIKPSSLLGNWYENLQIYYAENVGSRKRYLDKKDKFLTCLWLFQDGSAFVLSSSNIIITYSAGGVARSAVGQALVSYAKGPGFDPRRGARIFY